MSAKTKIFIDGSEGTTGLRIYERFEGRDDIELLHIDSELRKDVGERKRLINESDITFLCLPDDAARESVSLVENENVKIIDTSTAHRTQDGWAYGFPELSEVHRQKIREGKRIAVPGCYATGFITIIYPLIAGGILPADYPVSAFADGQSTEVAGVWPCGEGAGYAGGIMSAAVDGLRTAEHIVRRYCPV